MNICNAAINTNTIELDTTNTIEPELFLIADTVNLNAPANGGIIDAPPVIPSTFQLGPNQMNDPLNALLQIQLGTNDDMIYENLCWHYYFGFHHFEITHNGLSPKQTKLIDKFYYRVSDICTLHTRDTTLDETGADLSSYQWVLNLTDRQILYPHKSMAEIIADNADHRSVSFPSCLYNGFVPDEPKKIWPKTDELLAYRGAIGFDNPVRLTNSAATGDGVHISTDAHIATYATMEEAAPYAEDMIQDQLPFMDVMRESIQHAFVRSEKPWDHEYVEPIIQNEDENILDQFIQQNGINECIRSGSNYFYVNNQKSASSSIAKAHVSHEINRIINFPPHWVFHSLTSAIHDRYQKVLNKNKFKFTCVRNPYVRALSMYQHLILPHKSSYRITLNLNANTIITFKEFLNAVKRTPIKETDLHFRPQWCLTMTPLVQYTHIVHLENFTNEFRPVMDYLELPGEPNDYTWADHATGSSGKLSDFYDQECVDLAREVYEKDFDYFGYDKTPYFYYLENSSLINF
ncbi:MAG: sulfotransferase family 2 domain-containing protein [Pseudomonadota bacterium]